MSASVIPVDLKPILQNGFGGKSKPWEVVFLPVSGFPVPDQQVLPIRRLWSACRLAFLRNGQVPSEVFLQANHLGKAGSARLVDHGREWMPKVGLGVWPDREPPALWTHAEFQDLGPGERPRPLVYQVMRIMGEAATQRSAISAMLGTGVTLEIATPAGGEAFFKQSRELLLPPIKDPGFRKFPFYVPILELKSVESANPDLLEKWFCGASAYIRESPQDNGILIASKAPLTPLLERLGGEFLREPEPIWRIPVPQ